LQDIENRCHTSTKAYNTPKQIHKKQNQFEGGKMAEPSKSSLLEKLKNLLQKDDRFSAEGQLLKNSIVEHALKLDKDLLKLLLSSRQTKEHFFADVDGTLVFDKDKFIAFVDNKQFLPDSYTAFKNKVGLTLYGKDDFLKERKDVVLVWPYKDCVLEGGQTKEDQKRDEIFWNETLAPDEIDRLFEPKVLTNFKRIDKRGKHKVSEIKDTDNLIIKGNNLLVLHTLKKRFAGKVKLIYIDPPFNTTSAANTFAYNNSFNHSSWLTFIKNRIDICKSLLTEDGIMVVAIDHFELFYLGILLDEIFGRENRMGVIAVVHNPGGRQDDKFFPTAHENMLFYAKNLSLASLNTLGESQDKLSQFKYSDKYGKYKLRGFRRSGNNSRRKDRPGLFYPLFYNPKTKQIFLENKRKGLIKLLPIDEKGIERCWRWGAGTLLKKAEKYIDVVEAKSGFEVYIKERESDYKGEKAKTIWDKSKYSGQTGTHELKSILGDKLFSYPKSPYLISDVLKITTKPNDIVLDYFAGSGTTAQAVLELNKEDKGNRKFILCEQMHYVESVTVKRVQKVIENNGQGDFVYCELMQWNEVFIERIQKAKTKADLAKIWAAMREKGHLSYKIDLKEFDKNAAGFEQLNFDDQRKFLLEVLDKNQLYVNYCEIEDADYKVNKEDKKLNRLFYKD
jgi:adenine-specific DNA-methyltransferase